jgi:hypothetical protein
MLTVPSFERVALVTDDPLLAAAISALFRRPDHYFPVMDGPRMKRPDADNEVTRRRNALVMAGTKHLLLGGVHLAGAAPMVDGWARSSMSEEYEDHLNSLHGVVKRPTGTLRWGHSELGVGLYLARLQRKELVFDKSVAAVPSLVERSRHLLVACERGDELSQIIASNLAYSCGASFATFPDLPKATCENWVEELYALGTGGNVAARLGELGARARSHLGALDFSRYRGVLFVTGGFPWGIAVPELPTTHMRRYPDLGRAVIGGLWASQSNRSGARTALLVDPQQVGGSEIRTIGNALVENNTLVRYLRGPNANSMLVQTALDVLPYDVIVLSTHSGDAQGVRVTYQYPDTEGRTRRLVVEHVHSIARDLGSEMLLLKEFHRFHSIDGVDWRDQEAKAALPLGSALQTWLDMDGPRGRKEFVVTSEDVPRVVGSMAIALHDGNWLFTSHGMHPKTAPLVFNNACWSWHRLSDAFVFAGARGYVGTLFPVTDLEAQQVATAIFKSHRNKELFKALWVAQRAVYGDSGRRPYVIFGLPFVSIRANHEDSVGFTHHEYLEGIARWDERARESPHADVRDMAERYARFLRQDLANFRANCLTPA